jgi:pimeloyl-ACP methyl ester carboxylesterase
MSVTETTPHLVYTLSGQSGAPPLVFVNGLGGAQAAFSHQVRFFQNSRQVLTFDHRGVGGSDVVDTPVHMADFAADLVRLLDELKFEQVDAVGLSFGGRVLQQLAAGWPDRVRRMVIGGTSAGGVLHTPGNLDAHRVLRSVREASEAVWEEEIAPLLFGRAYREQYPERIRSLARWKARHPSNPVGLARQWEAWDSFDMGDQLEQVGCPVLILHGTDDALSPVENATQLAAHLPWAELELLDGIGHSPNVEDVDGFNTAIEAFLSNP